MLQQIGLLLKLCFGLLMFPFWLIILPFRMVGGLFGKQPKRARREPTYADGLWEGLIIGGLWD